MTEPKTITFSTGQTITVRPAPAELVRQFNAAVSARGANAGVIAQALAMILPYVTIEVDTLRAAAVRNRYMHLEPVVQAGDAVLCLMAAVVTPADAVLLSRALEGAAPDVVSSA